MDKNNPLKKDRAIKLQGQMAIAAFVAGVVIACVCLFIVPPPGEMSTSALSFASELLVLTGALLGINVSFDAKLRRLRAEVKENNKNENENDEI